MSGPRKTYSKMTEQFYQDLLNAAIAYYKEYDPKESKENKLEPIGVIQRLASKHDRRNQYLIAAKRYYEIVKSPNRITHWLSYALLAAQITDKITKVHYQNALVRCQPASMAPKASACYVPDEKELAAALKEVPDFVEKVTSEFSKANTNLLRYPFYIKTFYILKSEKSFNAVLDEHDAYLQAKKKDPEKEQALIDTLLNKIARLFEMDEDLERITDRRPGFDSKLVTQVIIPLIIANQASLFLKENYKFIKQNYPYLKELAATYKISRAEKEDKEAKERQQAQILAQSAAKDTFQLLSMVCSTELPVATQETAVIDVAPSRSASLSVQKNRDPLFFKPATALYVSELGVVTDKPSLAHSVSLQSVVKTEKKSPVQQMSQPWSSFIRRAKLVIESATETVVSAAKPPRAPRKR